MTNLVGRLRPKAACRILLGSHYDTRHVAEMDPDPRRRGEPIEGGNDGTSGVAVLLALAPRLSRLLPSGVGADVVLFDGEEMGYPGAGGYCAGSRRLASEIGSWKARPRFGVILDMVCDPRGVYRIEDYSRRAHPGLVKALWGLGSARAPSAFPEGPGLAILDDQVPLSEGGVPSVLVIGYNYPEWHTSADTLERCSRERLALIQGLLEDFIRERLAGFLEGCS